MTSFDPSHSDAQEPAVPFQPTSTKVHLSMPITIAVQASSDPMQAPNWLPWRVGRKVGRTIYAQVGAEASDDDVLIGVMDTAALAAEAAHAHNSILGTTQAMGVRGNG